MLKNATAHCVSLSLHVAMLVSICHSALLFLPCLPTRIYIPVSTTDSTAWSDDSQLSVHMIQVNAHCILPVVVVISVRWNKSDVYYSKGNTITYIGEANMRNTYSRPKYKSNTTTAQHRQYLSNTRPQSERPKLATRKDVQTGTKFSKDRC